MARKPKGDVNVNINITNKADAGGRSRKRKRKRQSRKKLDKSAPLKQADPEFRKETPDDLDLENALHHANNCTATTRIAAEWSHLPMIRFMRREKALLHDGRYDESDMRYRHLIYFNAECHRKLGIDYGQKLALFTERRNQPRYLIIQNVVRDFDSPSQIHKLGTFMVRRSGGQYLHKVRGSETETFHAEIGSHHWHKYPMALFANVPQLQEQYTPLYQLAHDPNLLIAYLHDLRAVPEDICERLTRVGGLVEDDLHTRNPAAFTTNVEIVK